jgi:hypothetical protein
MEAFSSLRALRQRIPEARYIKFPQVPALLAESIVIVAVDKIFGTG